MIDCMLLGFGRFGKEHLWSWEACSDARISAIVYPDARTSSVISPADGRPIAVFATTAQALENSWPDVAAVVTPSHTHHEMALSLIAKGIHCLIEKPLATSAALAREVRDAVNQSEVVCMPGHILRFSSPHVELRRRVQTGALVPTRLSFRRDRSAALSRMYAAEHPALLTGVHDIDLAYWITGSPIVEVSAQVTRADGAIVGFDADCLHDSGARSRIRGDYKLDMATPDAVDDEVQIADADNAVLAAWESCAEVAADSNDALVAEVQHFVDVVCGRVVDQRVTVSDAVHVIDVAEAIVRSAEQSNHVSVPTLPFATQ